MDIEKYHKGQLSAKEMHDLEKAALDDPFLADALEGYAVAGTNAAEDLAGLREKLAERIENNARVISINRGGRSFPWLRVAVMIVLVAGAGLLVYQLAFVNKKPEIAQNTKTDKAAVPVTSERAEEVTTLAPKVSDRDKAPTLSPVPATGQQQAREPRQRKTDSAVVVDNNISTTITETNNKPAAALPDNANERKAELEIAKESKGPDYDIAVKRKTAEFKNDKDMQGIAGQSDLKKQAMANAPVSNDYLKETRRPVSTNLFRGQIVDSNNNPLPYANITNVADNIGTYSDVKGNFVLTSPDSVLNVQVRSLGYADIYKQLPSNNQMQIMMQEDHSLSAVVISNKKTNSVRSRNSNMVLEEPEPIDGWANYDTYLANNLRVPDIVKSKQTTGGEVQLSFEVNKNGEPVNITVDRSLCESCDKEAIRLLKEGPRWKRKSTKGRTSVTIAF